MHIESLSLLMNKIKGFFVYSVKGIIIVSLTHNHQRKHFRFRGKAQLV